MSDYYEMKIHEFEKDGFKFKIFAGAEFLIYENFLDSDEYADEIKKSSEKNL